MSFVGTVSRIDDTTVAGRRLAYAVVAAIAPAYEIGPMEVTDDLEADLDAGDRVLLHPVDAIGDAYVVCGRLAAP